jgi:glycosyltransferase involved in cell wall biosynthesis
MLADIRTRFQRRPHLHQLEERNTFVPMHSLNRLAEQRSYDVVRMASVPRERVKLSVVIPNFNTADYVIEAIQSILAQTLQEFEIIVVDDGSSDDSIERLLSISDERLTCIRQSNRGLAGTRNTGLLVARGAYIGFLDSDDTWFPEKAARHLEIMDQNPSLGLTFSHSAYLHQSGTPTGQLLISRCARPTARDLVKRNHIGNGSTFIVRRACLEMAGGFDETIRNCEEWEFCVRVAACTNFKIQLIGEVLTGYRIREGSLSVSYDHFISNGDLAVARFYRYVPDFSDADARRASAQNCRIASRKALANGQIDLSRTLFKRAYHRYPMLVLCDPRATALALIHLVSLPLRKRDVMLVFRAVLSVMGFFYSRVAPRLLSLESGIRDKAL